MNKLYRIDTETHPIWRHLILIISVLMLMFSSLTVNATESTACNGTPGNPVCDLDTDKYLNELLPNSSCSHVYDHVYDISSSTNPNITITKVDSKMFNWTSTVKVCEVLVSGGGYFIPYKYDTSTCACSGQGLVAPIDSYNNCTFDISNIKFIHSDEPCSNEKCYGNGETGWAAGNPYANTANWATYVSYTGSSKTVDLLAGQTNLAGKVTLAPSNQSGMIKITITLNDGWAFADVMYNLKIHGYSSTPSWNSPKLGQFATKRTLDQSLREYTLDVNIANFYGIHVDLVKEIPCLSPQ